MKNFKKIWLASFLSVYLLAGLLLFIPNKSQATEGGMFDITQNINFKPQVGIPDSEFVTEEPIAVGGTGINAKGQTVVRSDLLAKYINAFYKWGLSIVAVIAVMVLMAGGLMWIVSGGESGTINKAKDMIFGSLTGMALLVGAWFFLNTINPKLTQLPAIEMVLVNKASVGCCQYSDIAKMETDAECKKNGGTPKLSDIDANSGEPIYYVANASKCILPGCCITNPGKPEAICYNRQESDCKSAVFQSDSAMTYITGSCSTQINKSLCKQGDWCQGAQNGSYCAAGSTNRCYNGICYVDNFGKENEPCGTQLNSYCSKEYSWTTMALCTKTGYGFDDSGGRSCGVGLACCFPKK